MYCLYSIFFAEKFKPNIDNISYRETREIGFPGVHLKGESAFPKYLMSETTLKLLCLK